MYDLEITIKRKAGPYPIRHLESPARVSEVAGSFLAAWGLVHPDELQPRGTPRLVDRLATTHKSYRVENDDYLIIVKPSA